MSLAESPPWESSVRASCPFRGVRLQAVLICRSLTEMAARVPLRDLVTRIPVAILLGLLVASGAARAQSRGDWVATQIAAHNQHLSASMRAEKYALMAESELNFYRATNFLFWADWGRAPQLQSFGRPRTRIWLQGDAHAENIGAQSNNRGVVVYDLNDFDETLIGDFQLDLWRLATSLLVLGHDRGGFSPQYEAQIVTALSKSYLRTLALFRGNNDELSSTVTAANTPSILTDFLLDVERSSTRRRMLGKNTTTERGVRRFDTSNPDYVPVSPEVLAAIEKAMPAYISSLAGRARYVEGYFRIKDAVQRARGGMGSLGVTRYLLLIEGPTGGQDDDRILDVKAQDVPAGWRYMDEAQREQLLRAAKNNHAQRVVMGTRYMGYRVDEHLGVMTVNGETFAVHERTPVYGTFSVHELVSPSRAILVAEVWGAVLATAHARADQDSSSLIPYDFEREVLAAVAGREESFHARVRQVALYYAAQVREDYLAFLDRLAHEPSPAGYDTVPVPVPRRGAVSRSTPGPEFTLVRSDQVFLP